MFECLKQIWKCGKFTMLDPKFALKLDGVAILNNGGDESNISWAEELMAPSQVRVSARFDGGVIFRVQRECPVNEWFFDA